ncbi:hypothetical protein CASFOL_001170 [Castilleja foliolosa]|uniref:NB-ARC domain-containing protein n=1 Tax=Castilleja foliolosa TaxID=1961234 RepID=A0ABD3EQN4_9LAMI
MACYAAVVSLKQTINHLKHSCNNLSLQIIEFAYEEVRSVQTFLQELDAVSGITEARGSYEIGSYDWETLNSVSAILKLGKSGESRGFRVDVDFINALDGKMREAVCQLEDALETHLVNHHDSAISELDLQGLKQDIDSFSLRVKELKEEYTKEVNKEDDFDSPRTEFHGDSKSTKMVGFSDVFCRMKDEFLECVLRIKMRSLIGMAGLGKTTLACKFFEHPTVLRWFDARVWVTVGPKYQLIDIVRSIINQVNPSYVGMPVEGDDLQLFLRRNLKDRRCLVVLDDVWNREITLHVKDLILEATFGRKDGSLILLTTRLDKVGASDRRITIDMIKLRFLNKEESWDLLREKVFDDRNMTCPPELEKAGKMIAENCEGLPLTIITVADILAKADQMTSEHWDRVAKKENSVFVDAYDQMSKVLLQSYDYLPRYLKEYFLYMGVFPQKYDIPLSKLAMMWSVEGCFLLRDSKSFGNLQGYVSKHLEDLIGKNLVLVLKKSYKNKPKAYGLHSALWHACVREAGRNKFFHVFNIYADSLVAERLANQRRLCVHNNVLFGIKDVRKSMSSISTARSLLCTGPHQRYPVPVCFGQLRLLRVIDALTIRFYEFPMQVVKLYQLRYLGLTSDENLPATISKLLNLQILIVHRHLSIIKLHEYESSSCLPMEIWDMKELEHLQVIGGDLPEPCDGAVLPNLMTLLDVSPRVCTKHVFKGLPKLKKLGIRIELSADYAPAEPLCCFEHISHLNKLESLKCVVVNPVFRSEIVTPLVSISVFPKSLKTLSLSGLGCAWDDIKGISSLPRLEVLKLRGYAFRGPKWETPNKGFPSLELLLIEDTDLVQWTTEHESFSKLQCLSLKQCYKLQEMGWRPGKSLKRIEIVDCSPSSVNCAKQMQKNRSTLEVCVHSSWDDGKKLKA